ncbi:predicted protein [Arabidopsis lyrata subsp. lyrata]|uniref:Predicted protein n=1 Tax=Arabidopsis lyrata subsp. lyrata TaxID=81972 RepID=D7KPI0_ARALL|nr:predicted protein [Arabidopsis lyrata subsp. lyrata]
MVGRSLSPAFTLDDARSFVNDVKEAFGADETAKYREFLDILQGLRANRIDYPTLVATVEELLKDHQDLLLRFNAFFAVEPKDSKGRVCERVKRVLKGHPNLLRGFRVFVPARSTITIASTKSEQRAASDNNKRIRVANFITKLKARFQGNDRHVYESFLEILTMYQEGNKSVNDLYQEVIALLQGHEDLVMEFEDESGQLGFTIEFLGLASSQIQTMIERRVSPEPTLDDAVSFIDSVKEAFHDEPAKFHEFKALLNDVRDHRVDNASVIARMNELIRGYPKLLRGSRVFLPEAEITIPPKAEQRPESDGDQKKCADLENHMNKLETRLDTLVFPTMTEKTYEGRKSIKELHEEVVFLSEDKITIPPKADRTIPSEANKTIPPEANKGLSQFQTMVGKSVRPKKTINDARSYIYSVKEAFHDEPAKYAEFLKLLDAYRARRVDKDSVIARVEELTKDHRDLLLGLSAFLPAATKTIPHKADELTSLPEANRATPPKASRTIPLKFKITIPPKARRTIPSEAEKPTHSDELNFMNKLKTRFQRIDNHVVGSFRSIMKMYEEGKKSVKEVHEEVYDLLYYHEDLIEDFSRIFPDPFASTSLLRSPVIGRRVSLKLTMDADRLNIASTEKAFHERERTTMRETVTYIAHVKEAFLDEPAKFDEFLKLMKDVCDHKIDEANGSAMMAEIIKGHPNLLLRLGVFFPKYSVNKHKGKRTIPPDDEHGGSAESSNNKKNRAANFMENLEARFQGDGGHVVNSVLQIIRMYTIEGNKSKNEAYHEVGFLVVALLQGHVDLIMEFGEYFSDKLSQPKYA